MSQAQAATLTLAAAIQMAVSKNVDKGGKTVRENVGSIELYSPTLAAFGINVEPTGADKDTGELTYANLDHQWLYSAILAAVKSNARNKLAPGSTSVKAGTKLPTTLEELVTPSENTSTVLADRRALFDYFKGFLATLEKPENVKRLLISFLEKPELLGVQPADKRAQIKPYFEQFGQTIEARLNEWQFDYLLSVVAQCDAEEIQW